MTSRNYQRDPHFCDAVITPATVGLRFRHPWISRFILRIVVVAVKAFAYRENSFFKISKFRRTPTNLSFGRKSLEKLISQSRFEMSFPRYLFHLLFCSTYGPAIFNFQSPSLTRASRDREIAKVIYFLRIRSIIALGWLLDDTR